MTPAFRPPSEGFPRWKCGASCTTKFRRRSPATVRVPGAFEGSASRPLGGSTGPDVSESNQMAGPVRRILIADDHDVIRRGVRTLIETRANLQVVAEASTGREALIAARESAPDIAIIDYSLPEVNGLDLTISLRREMPRVEILIYTMHDREDIIMDVLRAGARGFVLKSDSERHLFAAIDALSIHRPYFSGAVSETLLEQVLRSKPSLSESALTHREREVVQLIAEGRINKEVAEALHISIKTVETHRSAVMHKLKLRTTAELVRYAVRNNIVQA